MNTAQLIVLAVFGALAGACVGSFVCVVIDRMPFELDGPNEFGDRWGTHPWREVLGGESRCSSCGADIRATDNVPLLGWLRLRGKCRGCGARIPGYLPLVELLVPAIGAWMVATVGLHWQLLPVLWLVPVGVAIAGIDLRSYIVPTKLVWPAWFVSIALSVVAAAGAGEWRWLLGAALGALTFAGPLFVIWFIRPAGMGFGDIRLTVLLGWTVGLVAATDRPISSVFMAVCSLSLSAVIGIVLAFVGLTARGRNARVPFGPPLVLGTLVCIAWAPEILRAFDITA